jgi:acetyltransferase EpsM
MEKKYIYGAGGHGKVILEIFEANNIVIEGVFDENWGITKLLDYPVLGGLSMIKATENAALLISIGNNVIRKKIAEELNCLYLNAIHPAATISRRSSIGEGCAIMAGVCINSNVTIGNHVILNTNCSVDHDCMLGNYVHISPNAALAGNVSIGEGTHVGIGVAIIPNIKIGNWCTIGAGAVIIRDVPDYAVVVGNPGRIINYNSKIE